VDGRDQDVITLTHVCRAWREVFISRATLWSYLDAERMNEGKAHVYLERSKTSSISLSLYREDSTFPSDPFLQIIPQVIGRLVDLFIMGTPENVQDAVAYLSRPAPLLQDMTIRADSPSMSSLCTVLTSTLFDGDLSSLRELHLGSVRAEPPWRNMVNLTTFSLSHMPPDDSSVRHLLDFFEGAPHLRKVELYLATPTSGAQNGRLVPLACLEGLVIYDSQPPSILLDHLLIPVGAELVLEGDLLNSLVGDLLPRSLSNLGNLSNFTTVKLCINESRPRMEFSGPNGKVSLTPTGSEVHKTDLVLESLTQLDTSKTERFRIEQGQPLSRGLLYRALLPMERLRVLVLYECYALEFFIYPLYHTASSEVGVCPKLEELVLVLHASQDACDVKSIIEMAGARASRGRKLKTVKIVDRGDGLDPEDVLELRKHVGHVEYTHWTGGIVDELL